jgi:hypothetical protein
LQTRRDRVTTKEENEKMIAWRITFRLKFHPNLASRRVATPKSRANKRVRGPR